MHQGAVGAGINQATGVTTTACCNNQLVSLHPDTYNKLSGVKLPFWEEIISLSAQCYDLSNLGYLGVDIVIDNKLGPLMLELNARPGLSIQIANQIGLQEELKKINIITNNNKQLPLKKRIEISQQLALSRLKL